MNWILKLSFVQRALKEAERQGGIKAFPLAQKDILDTMRDDLDKQAEELADKKLSALLSTVDISQIVATKGRNVLIGGQVADDIKISNLKAEADFFSQSELWKLLQETPKALAERAMFMDDGKLETNLLKGRAILFMLATQQKIVTLFQELSTSPK